MIQKSAGLYTHLGWGTSLDKAGTFTGGPYFFGGSPCGYYGFDNTDSVEGAALNAGPPFWRSNFGGSSAFVRADIDTFTGLWLSHGDNPSAFLGYTGKLCYAAHAGNNFGAVEVPNYEQFWQRQTSSFNGMANLYPSASSAVAMAAAIHYSARCPTSSTPMRWDWVSRQAKSTRWAVIPMSRSQFSP